VGLRFASCGASRHFAEQKPDLRIWSWEYTLIGSGRIFVDERDNSNKRLRCLRETDAPQLRDARDRLLDVTDDRRCQKMLLIGQGLFGVAANGLNFVDIFETTKPTDDRDQINTFPFAWLPHFNQGRL